MINIPEDTARALNRYIGLTGCGPTRLDLEYRDPTQTELDEYAEVISEEKAARAEAWKQAILSVLGEE